MNNHQQHLLQTTSRPTTRLYALPPRRPAASGVKRGPDEERPGPRKPTKDDVIQVTGKVTESLPNAMFRVEIEPTKQVVLATISGKIRKNMVRIVVGDSVTMELSAYDLTRGMLLLVLLLLSFIIIIIYFIHTHIIYMIITGRITFRNR